MRTVVVAAALAAAGCGGGGTGGGGPAPDPQQVTLSEVADLLRSPERPTAKLADLARFEALYPRGYGAIKAGEVVVVWGTPMMTEGEAESGGAGTVIAYEKNAPTAGGWALFSSGQIKKVTAADIPAAKAKK